jgi:hypothetical protein
MENQIPKQYLPLLTGIDSLSKTNVNCMIVESNSGLAKSYWIDQILKDMKINYILFKGYISEARFYKFIQDNADKVIVMRDCGSMLNSKFFLDFLKSATDIIESRTISRMTYAEHEGVEETIEFKGKVIWEINELPKRNKEDIDAIIRRSLHIKLNLSINEIIDIMKLICKTDWEIEVTSYLISRVNEISIRGFNFRTQNICFMLYQNCIKENRDWKKEIDMFLDIQVSIMRKMLYRFAGEMQVKRIDFVKYLMIDNGFEYRTAQRKIAEHIEIGEIFTNGLEQNMLISTKPFETPQVTQVSII